MVTEGIADALVAARIGNVAVGILGTAAIDGASATRIAVWAREHVHRVVLCFDGDQVRGFSPNWQVAAQGVII